MTSQFSRYGIAGTSAGHNVSISLMEPKPTLRSLYNDKPFTLEENIFFELA
jgi:hypothetical protein